MSAERVAARPAALQAQALLRDLLAELAAALTATAWSRGRPACTTGPSPTCRAAVRRATQGVFWHASRYGEAAADKRAARRLPATHFSAVVT